MKENIDLIKEEIGDCLLVAVSKTKSNEDILKAYDLGIRDFGENYVQELIDKMDNLPSDIRWHMIGHLQTNKVKELVKRNIYLIESVDSIKLANTINKEAIKNNKIINILIEVNIVNDPNKTGCLVDDLDSLINEVKELSNIKLLGLMGIGPNTDNDEEIRDAFRRLKELKDKYDLELLSMGMSNDYRIAVEEGSNIVRIGTKIFGKREKIIKCPNCNNKMIRIEYGMPSDELIELSEKGIIHLGGCCIGEDDPIYYCKNCKRKYFDNLKDYLEDSDLMEMLNDRNN